MSYSIIHLETGVSSLFNFYLNHYNQSLSVNTKSINDNAPPVTNDASASDAVALFSLALAGIALMHLCHLFKLVLFDI